MQLIEAMNRKQQKITLFIHYWMDSGGGSDPLFPMEMKESEWLAEFEEWEREILTDELLEAHMTPPVPTEIFEAGEEWPLKESS